uniref:RNA helicase n=1 Tax=Ditylenchus dipsaci TaxID=166011 RepID=A0A915DDX4_9BILA
MKAKLHAASSDGSLEERFLSSSGARHSSSNVQQEKSYHNPNSPTSACDNGAGYKEDRRRKGHFPKPKFDDQFQEQSNQIRIYGGDGVPLRIKVFDQCNFTSEVKNNILLRKYIRPLPIQSCIIPDVVGHAKTGAGKTAAFMLPIVNEIQLYKEEKAMGNNPGYPFAVLIAPTKELAEQLHEDIRSFAQGTIRGMKKDGCDIFVGTCGRVRHFIKDQIVRLDEIRYFILDEADKLLRDGSFDEIMHIKNHQFMNPNHRTLLFSATFEEDIQIKFEELLRADYFLSIIEVSRYEKYDVLINLLKKVAKLVEGINPWVHYEVEKTIIFAGQKRRTDRIAIALALQGFKVTSTNGDRTLQQRNEAKNGFIRGEYDILVATDVFEDLNYIHRIGRAGRAGNVGRATTFFDADADAPHASFYVQVLKDADQMVPDFLREIVENQKLADEEVIQNHSQEGKSNNQPLIFGVKKSIRHVVNFRLMNMFVKFCLNNIVWLVK